MEKLTAKAGGLMKSKLTFALATLIFIITLSCPVLAAPSPSKELNSNEKISRQQLEAQVSFFNEALSEFGASSPDEAIRLWVKGDQTRNGVYKYAVSCNSLKQRYINNWGEPEKGFWIIGGSSPWLTHYQIISKSIISPSEIKYMIQYLWATSAGPEAPSTEQLIIKRINDKWCVSSVLQSDGYHSF